MVRLTAIEPTASVLPSWIRKAAERINSLLIDGARMDTRLAAMDEDIAALIERVEALEAEP